MKKWIFQCIKDLEDEMYRDANENHDGWVIGKPIRQFHAKLRKNIDPELYTRYLLCHCDIYVDVAKIAYEVCEIYPNVTKRQVCEWLMKHKSEHHDLLAPNSWYQKVGESKYRLCIPD